MGMKVVYWSKNSVASQYQKVELTDLFKNADLIFPCLAQNEETKNYITDEMLNSMKNKAIFISIVHKIYNHDLLLQLAKENKIYGYAFETPNQEMLNYEGNVWAGPEQAWNTKESLGRNLKIWQENIIKAAQNNFEFRVN
jgi:phosphoglycerate dehydrogenase-like enzyme